MATLHPMPSTSVLVCCEPACEYVLLAGSCAVCEKLPVPQRPTAEFSTSVSQKGNGLNMTFGATVHCVAAEPLATFMRIAVSGGNQEIAYETVVLGRLRVGYRVLPLRSSVHGTRIELAYLFVCIRIGDEPNLWPTARHLRTQATMMAQNMREPTLLESEK
eukprot:7380144-Prymnesium_polylepis.2